MSFGKPPLKMCAGLSGIIHKRHFISEIGYIDSIPFGNTARVVFICFSRQVIWRKLSSERTPRTSVSHQIIRSLPLTYIDFSLVGKKVSTIVITLIGKFYDSVSRFINIGIPAFESYPEINSPFSMYKVSGFTSIFIGNNRIFLRVAR